MYGKTKCKMYGYAKQLKLSVCTAQEKSFKSIRKTTECFSQQALIVFGLFVYLRFYRVHWKQKRKKKKTPIEA